MSILSTRDITYVKGVGPRIAKILAKIDIFTPMDALYYLPRSYEDRRQLPMISQLRIGSIQLVQATVGSISEKKTSTKKSVIKAELNDTSGRFYGLWFNQAYVKRHLNPGQKVLVKGNVQKNMFTGHIEMAVSELEKVNLSKPEDSGIGKIMPIYGLTHGLYQSKIRQIIREVIDRSLDQLVDPIPNTYSDAWGIVSLRQALRDIHFPASSEAYHAARHRLVFDEAFAFQLSLEDRKQQRERRKGAYPLRCTGTLLDRHESTRPYELTNAQKKAIADIQADVTSDIAMNRLIQGDVGSGKTDVAMMALLLAINSEKKAAMMVPTEILAEQHFLKLSSAFEPLGVEVWLLKGSLSKKDKVRVTKRLADSQPCVLIGTHAIIQKTVPTSDIALIVIDEQHRFGVMQRIELSNKGMMPHCLYLTATPIPRSLSLTCFGDLDKSIMNELPPGRKVPKTLFFKPNNLATIYDFAKTLIDKGEQVYIVFPLVEESEKTDLEDAISNTKRLSEGVFSSYTVALLHGRMAASEKQDVMDKFKKNIIQVLVATTVIEVGVDVPNATCMIITHAERFGLSQLHQLRGRVGRGGAQAYCFLIADPKTDNGKRRIKAMVDTNDGFKIAEADLNIRGAGDILGTRQSGLPEFNILDLVQDEDVLMKAKNVVDAILARDPMLELSVHKTLKDEMLQKKRVHIVQKALN